MKDVTTFLWFDGQALDAAEHYTSIFEDGKILEVMRNGSGGPGEPGSVLMFELQRDPNQVKAQAVVAAMLRMGKLDPVALQAAFDAA